jgi:hypothetical protein
MKNIFKMVQAVCNTEGLPLKLLLILVVPVMLSGCAQQPQVYTMSSRQTLVARYIIPSKEKTIVYYSVTDAPLALNPFTSKILLDDIPAHVDNKTFAVWEVPPGMHTLRLFNALDDNKVQSESTFNSYGGDVLYFKHIHPFQNILAMSNEQGRRDVELKEVSYWHKGLYSDKSNKYNIGNIKNETPPPTPPTETPPPEDVPKEQKVISKKTIVPPAPIKPKQPTASGKDVQKVVTPPPTDEDVLKALKGGE